MKKFKAYLFILTSYHTFDIEKKIKLYEECIEGLEKTKKGTICVFLRCFCLNERGSEDYNMYSDFPELYIQKPKNIKKYRSGLWFDIFNHQGRIEILKKAIETLKR